MEDNDNIFESVTNWWIDKIRETTYPAKVSDKNIESFQNLLKNSIKNEFAYKGYITIAILPNNLLTKCLKEANINLNPLLMYEMNLTPNFISIYDKYGNLIDYKSL